MTHAFIRLSGRPPQAFCFDALTAGQTAFCAMTATARRPRTAKRFDARSICPANICITTR